jgi:ABC-type transport system involved in cytochrome c biogenesis permease subunit
MKKFPWRAAVICAGLLCLFPSRAPAPGGFNLTDFSGLPVLHAGRVKPIDTVARTALLMLRGQQELTIDGKRVSAVEWLMDLMARPEATDVQRVFRIDDPDLLGLLGKTQTSERYYSFMDLEPFLKELSEQGQRAEKIDAGQRGRFENAAANLDERLTLYQSLKNTLRPDGAKDWTGYLAGYRELTPVAARAVAAHTAGKPFDNKQLEALNPYFESFRFLSQASDFRALPPREGESDAAWKDLGDGLLTEMNGRQPHPGIDAYAAMMTAYRTRDSRTFNAALSGYRDWISTEQPAAVRRARQELWFNRLEPFYRGMVLYLIAFLLVLASWAVWPQILRRSAVDLAWLAFAVHTSGLIFRIVLQGRPPVTNLYSSAIFVGWAAALLGLILERLHRNGYGTLVASVTGFSTLIIAHHLANQGDTMEMMRAVLDSNFWLSTHVVSITIGYSSMFLAAALAHVYIFKHLLGAAPDPAGDKSLVSMTYGIICFSLFFSFVGTVLGGIWADQSWGRFWGWDPKENGALLIVLWNAIVLHARWGGYVRERGIMVMAVFGGIITSLSWFGVNMLGIGLHSYGFMQAAFDWLIGFIAVELLVMALGVWAVPLRQDSPKAA